MYSLFHILRIDIFFQSWIHLISVCLISYLYVSGIFEARYAINTEIVHRTTDTGHLIGGKLVRICPPVIYRNAEGLENVYSDSQ
jgi:hypothetical protein